MSIFHHRTRAGRAGVHRNVAMLQQAFATAAAAGEITTDAAGHTVMPADFLSNLNNKLNEGKSLGLGDLLDKIARD